MKKKLLEKKALDAMHVEQLNAIDLQLRGGDNHTGFWVGLGAAAVTIASVWFLDKKFGIFDGFRYGGLKNEGVMCHVEGLGMLCEVPYYVSEKSGHTFRFFGYKNSERLKYSFKLKGTAYIDKAGDVHVKTPNGYQLIAKKANVLNKKALLYSELLSREYIPGLKNRISIKTYVQRIKNSSAELVEHMELGKVYKIPYSTFSTEEELLAYFGIPPNGFESRGFALYHPGDDVIYLEVPGGYQPITRKAAEAFNKKAWQHFLEPANHEITTINEPASTKTYPERGLNDTLHLPSIIDIEDKIADPIKSLSDFSDLSDIHDNNKSIEHPPLDLPPKANDSYKNVNLPKSTNLENLLNRSF